MRRRASLVAVFALVLLVFASGSPFGRFSLTKDEARRVVDFVHERYRNDYLSPGGGRVLDWQKAAVALMFVHAFETIGDPRYLNWASEALYVAYDRSDAQCWGGLAILELGLHGIRPTPKPFVDAAGTTWLPSYRVEDIFDLALTTARGTAPAPYSGFWDDPELGGRGGIFLELGAASYDSRALAPAIVLAYRMPGSSIEGKDARDLASAWLDIADELLVDRESGQIYGNYDLESRGAAVGDRSGDYGAILASLGLAWMLDRERHADAPELAAKIVAYVLGPLSRGGLLSPSGAGWGNRDSRAYNGLFMHLAPLFLFSTLPTEARSLLKEYLRSNAAAVWTQASGKGGPGSKDYSVSYAWDRAFDGWQADCMTTVSGAECLLAWLQVEEGIPPPEYAALAPK